MRQLEILAMLAWRNLWRNHRRTIIMISAITVGVWAMIFMTALLRGMVNDMLRDGIQTLPGHVQIHHPGFRDDPSVNNLIPATGTLGAVRGSASLPLPRHRFHLLQMTLQRDGFSKTKPIAVSLLAGSLRTSSIPDSVSELC